jgi:hypothetical protein
MITIMITAITMTMTMRTNMDAATAADRAR